ncbi:PepSY domain-containing protein [Desertibaculum subflavum]|uniref:PepSY domain-containing protein n=1 Tax=Desertibaculum subflavum TaxID=2268458 RepID=UPI000E65EF09
MTRFHAWLLLLALAGDLARATPARADGYDHELARRAVEAGEAKPLAEILPLVRERFGGELVGIEFEREGGVWIYEFKVVDTSGRKTEIYVNALTGAVVQVKDKGRHRGKG